MKNAKQNFRGPSSIDASKADKDNMETGNAVANNSLKNKTGKAEKAVQKKSAEEEDKVQRKEAGNSTPVVSSGFQSAVENAKGGGTKLGSGIAGFMSSKLGADFSGVRIHNNSRAHQLAESIDAKAFTVGSDVYFNKGEYRPETKEGKHLIAHELVHTMQQTGSDELQRKPLEKKKVSLPKPKTCEGKEDITELVKKLVAKAPGIIDKSSLSTQEKEMKKKVVQFTFANEGIFSLNTFKFLACDKINLPHLSGVSGMGANASFGGYSSTVDKEIAGVKSFKYNIEDFLKNGDMDSLLQVVKLVAHEVRHLTLSGVPGVAAADTRSGKINSNEVELAQYLVEEILVNAEEIAVNYRFQNGKYAVPLETSYEIHRYWNQIKRIVNDKKIAEMRQFIIQELNKRYSLTNRSNALTVGILNAMERGNWNHNP